MNTNTGDSEFKYTLTDKTNIRTTVVISENAVYFGCYDKNIYCIDLDTLLIGNLAAIDSDFKGHYNSSRYLPKSNFTAIKMQLKPSETD